MYILSDKNIVLASFVLIASTSVIMKNCFNQSNLAEGPQPLYEEGEPFHLTDEYPPDYEEYSDIDWYLEDTFVTNGDTIIIGTVVDTFNNLGMLIVPYEKCDNFDCAYSYARCKLGDRESTGRMQYFIWRGGMFHTEMKEEI